MKIRFHLFVSVLLMASCGKEEETPSTITFPAGTNTQLSLAAGTDSKQISFTAASAWSLSVVETRADQPDWIMVYPSSGDAGAASVTVETRKNTTTSQRKATVTISAGGDSKSFTITQAPGEVPAFTISQAEDRAVVATGEVFTVTVTSNTAWDVESDDTAIATVAPASGEGNGSVTVTVKANRTIRADGATITFIPDAAAEKSFDINRAANSVHHFAVGDYWPDPYNTATAEGLVFWLKEPTDGRSLHGKVVAVEEPVVEESAGWFEWCNISAVFHNDYQRPDLSIGVYTILVNADDGSEASKLLRELNPGIATLIKYGAPYFPLFDWLDSRYELDYEWYIPAINELKQLHASYNGVRYEDIPDWGISENMPFAYSNSFARQAFDAKLTAVDGGKAFATTYGSGSTTAVPYWSSTLAPNNLNVVLSFYGFGFIATWSINQEQSFPARIIRKF